MSAVAALKVPVTSEDHVRGPTTAAITLVEYGDYECPYCGEAFGVVRDLQQAFGDSLRLVFRNFPLANVHPHAEDAAEMAEAVALQSRFWEIHALLYENQQSLDKQALAGYAERAGADVAQALGAIDDGGPRRRVRSDLEGGLRSGVNGTPSFFVNGSRHDGSWDYSSFADYLRRLAG